VNGKTKTSKKKTNKIVTKEDEREKTLICYDSKGKENNNEKEKFEWCDRHM
jgi:hypothetical protein